MDTSVEAAQKRISAVFQRMARTSNVSHEVLEEAQEEFATVLEELNTSLEELQTNNETLVQTRLQLEKEHQRYQELFYYAPDAYLETDIKGMIIQANEAASLLFNLSLHFLVNKPLSVFVVHDDLDKFFEMFRPPRRITDLELKMQPRSRPHFIASISLVPVKDMNGQSVGIRWLIRDITANKLEQATLTASEERFRTIFTHSHIGMMLTDLEGRLVESNLAFERMIGYIHDELQGLQLDGLVDPKDREGLHHVRTAILDKTRASSVQEIRYLNKNEQVIWTRQSTSALPNLDGEAVYFIHMVENITAEKQSEEELSEMKRRMIESIESERLHLAQELHDGPIQDLYGAVFKLTETQRPEMASTDKDNIKETQDLIKQVAGTLRVICGDLRPPTLSNFGLDRAIQAHVDQHHEDNGALEIILQADRDDRLLSQDVRLGLFRIYQQCIANVMRHSQATEVIVRLEIGEEEVVLQVEDNGVGFDPPARMVDLLRTGHYGLAGIAERVESLNGSLMIDSGQGLGTRVTVEVPRQGVPSEQS